MSIGILVLIIVVLLYFLPTVIAASRNHRNTTASVVCNILFGWTFIGWGIAMVWAFKD
jgi:threonine/homoserine/homoserine lactone efflux protein